MYAHGKLLITGEYFVLDGALALAVPSRLGQSLEVKEGVLNELNWQSIDHKGFSWFSAQWTIENDGITLQKTSDEAIAQRLESIFKAAIEQQSKIGLSLKGKKIITRLEFPREWGLGTSSTLISLLSQYWKINPFQLLEKSFGGSGYDIACASANGPIIYQKTSEYNSAEQVKWNPDFKHQLFFVYQGQKQNSREGIRHYRANAKSSNIPINDINELTLALLHAKTFNDCSRIIREHENIVSNTIRLPKVKEERFKDFPGEVKSLGAWGGDFVMALSPWDSIKTTQYFNSKGYPVVLSFEEMVLQELT